jgi:hypothetical protein
MCGAAFVVEAGEAEQTGSCLLMEVCSLAASTTNASRRARKLESGIRKRALSILLRVVDGGDL